jgi:hypothetical protein
MRAAFVVFCGVALWTLLWLGGNAALASLIPHVYRDDGTTGHAGVLGVILLLSGLCSLAAGYVVSALARGRWRGHAIALGAALLAIGVLVQSQYWQLLPVWYHVIFLAGLLPVSLLGARLRAGRTPSA